MIWRFNENDQARTLRATSEIGGFPWLPVAVVAVGLEDCQGTVGSAHRWPSRAAYVGSVGKADSRFGIGYPSCEMVGMRGLLTLG